MHEKKRRCMGIEDRESDFLIERNGCSSYGPPDFVCYHGAGDVVIAISMYCEM